MRNYHFCFWANLLSLWLNKFPKTLIFLFYLIWFISPYPVWLHDEVQEESDRYYYSVHSPNFLSHHSLFLFTHIIFSRWYFISLKDISDNCLYVFNNFTIFIYIFVSHRYYFKYYVFYYVLVCSFLRSLFTF